MLKRKDYRLIASAIRYSTMYARSGKRLLGKDKLIEQLCIMLKQDNNLFNKDIFIDACD